MDDKQKEVLKSRNIEILTGDVDYSQYFTIRQCAEIMDLSMGTVRKRIEKGEIPAKYHDAGEGKARYIISRKDVEVATITKDVVEVPRPITILELVQTFSVAIHEENIALREEQRETNERLDRIEKLLLEQKKSAPQLSFWEKLRSLLNL